MLQVCGLLSIPVVGSLTPLDSRPPMMALQHPALVAAQAQPYHLCFTEGHACYYAGKHCGGDSRHRVLLKKDAKPRCLYVCWSCCWWILKNTAMRAALMTVDDAREFVNQDDWPWQIVEERVPLPAAPAGTAPAEPPGIPPPLPPVPPPPVAPVSSAAATSATSASSPTCRICLQAPGEDRVKDLEARLTVLEDQVKDLEARLKNAGSLPSDSAGSAVASLPSDWTDGEN